MWIFIPLRHETLIDIINVAIQKYKKLLEVDEKKHGRVQNLLTS